MPQVYADNHNDIIERFADTGLAVPKWKDKVVFGKSNTGYIFPLVINTRAIYNVYLSHQLNIYNYLFAYFDRLYIYIYIYNSISQDKFHFINTQILLSILDN